MALHIKYTNFEQVVIYWKEDFTTTVGEAKKTLELKLTKLLYFRLNHQKNEHEKSRNKEKRSTKVVR